jgi:hypothetical protein
MGGGFLPKSKLIETIKSTIGYDTGMDFVRESKDAWPNDNPFTTTSTIPPLTTEAEKVTQTQTAMLEIFQWLSSTFKPILSTMSTTTSGSYVTDRDEWANSVETYRVDEPPHSPGLSECRFESSYFMRHAPVALLFCVLSDIISVLFYLLYVRMFSAHNPTSTNFFLYCLRMCYYLTFLTLMLLSRVYTCKVLILHSELNTEI